MFAKSPKIGLRGYKLLISSIPYFRRFKARKTIFNRTLKAFSFHKINFFSFKNLFKRKLEDTRKLTIFSKDKIDSQFANKKFDFMVHKKENILYLSEMLELSD